MTENTVINLWIENIKSHFVLFSNHVLKKMKAFFHEKKKSLSTKKMKEIIYFSRGCEWGEKNHSWEFVATYLSFTQIWGSNLYLLCGPETPDQKLIYSRLGILGHITKQVQCWPGLSYWISRERDHIIIIYNVIIYNIYNLTSQSCMWGNKLPWESISKNTKQYK